MRGLELEVAELEKECELHQKQERALKEALRDVERERKREEVGTRLGDWLCVIHTLAHHPTDSAERCGHGVFEECDTQAV